MNLKIIFLLILLSIYSSGCMSSNDKMFIDLMSQGEDYGAVNTPHYLLNLAIKSDNKSAVILLLKNGADPNIRDVNNEYAISTLVDAINGGNYEIIELLLKYGVNTNIKKTHWTPLRLAATWKPIEKSIKLTKLLMQYGANLNFQPFGPYADTLLIHCVRKKSFEYIKFLCDNGVCVNTPGAGLRTPLIIATLFCRYNIVELLLKNNADINSHDEEGLTALDFAYGEMKHSSNNNIITIKKYEDIIDLLHKHGAKTAEVGAERALRE